MAQRRGVRFTRAARLGLAALVLAIAAGVALYLGMRLLRAGGYRMAVHFPTAAGIAPGALVYFNGVNVGTVQKVKILPDTTVDFTLAITRDVDIPANAKYTVQSTFTGSPTVNITVPVGAKRAAVEPKRVLPLAQQPVGTPPLSLQVVMRQGLAVGDRAQSILESAMPYGKRLRTHLEHARANGGAMMQQMQTSVPAVLATLRSATERAQANAARAQAAIVHDRNHAEIGEIAASFKNSAADLQRAAAALNSVKRDSAVQANVRAASAQLRVVTAHLAGLSRDLQMIAGNPQTKAQLQDIRQRLNAILRSL